MLAFACSNRASGSTHRSSQSNANAVLIPSKFNAFPQHTLSSGCFLSSPLSSFIQVSEETVLSLSLRCEDTHTRENREQAKQRRTSSSLSLSPPHTDHRRIARSPCQNATESPIIFIPVEGPFFQVNLSDGPSRSLSLTLSLCAKYLSLSLYIEVFFLRTSFSSLTNR